ncbi:MAG: lipid-A-disaccharide synthase, partial [Muribaculaceae bacterium]|nr:lipid-A-disaccharide synthase [Muribaculaceae bacterium]
MHYFISAGEASGDLHAADLIRELKVADPDATFTFLGGDKMAEASGRGSLIHYREMAYMGFINVAMNLKKVLSNLSTAQNALIAVKPDCLILVDYPSFNLRLAETAYSRNIPVYYYISPKVWAWKENRVKTMKS